MLPRLLERYRDGAVPKLREEFGYSNLHEVPGLVKTVVNIGLGEATQNSKLLDRAAEELALITGQKPTIRRAKKSVSNFKLREGQPIVLPPGASPRDDASALRLRDGIAARCGARLAIEDPLGRPLGPGAAVFTSRWARPMTRFTIPAAQGPWKL